MKKNKGKIIKINYFSSFLIPYLAILIILIVLPMLVILLYSVTNQKSEFPIYGFTMSNYFDFFKSQELVKALIKSIYLSFITTIFCIIFAYPISYFIAKRTAKSQAILILLVTSPMWINMLLRTLAVKQLFEGPLLKIMMNFGIERSLLGTDFAVIFGMVYNYLPFMVLPIYTILSKLDYKLIEASTDLGANKYQNFTKVILPLSVPGILSGVTIVFLSAATTIVISKYLGDGKYMLIGNIIETQFIENAQWSYGSAISIILLGIIMLLMWLTAKSDKSAKEMV